MKNIKSILGTVVSALLLTTGCENSITSQGDKNYSSNETEFQNDDLNTSVFRTKIKLAPEELAMFDSDNLPMKIFNYFKIRSISESTGIKSNTCNDIEYQFGFPNATGSVEFCFKSGEEFFRNDGGFNFMCVRNLSKSPILLEIIISE